MCWRGAVPAQTKIIKITTTVTPSRPLRSAHTNCPTVWSTSSSRRCCKARRPNRCNPHRQWSLSRKSQERVHRARWASSRWCWALLPPSTTPNRTRPIICITPSEAIEATKNYARSSSLRSIATCPARGLHRCIAAAWPLLLQWTTHRCFRRPHISCPHNHSRNRPTNFRTDALRTLRFKKWGRWLEGNETYKWPKVISLECWRSSVTRRRRHMSKSWRKVSTTGADSVW